MEYPQNVQYKSWSGAEWEPWFYLPPSEKTIQIFKREVKATINEMKERGKIVAKNVCTVFYGKPVYAFKFFDGKEVYLDV